MRSLKYSVLVLSTLLFSACSDDSVIFVTATSIGLDGDTKTATANIGYNRQEGVYAPVYDGGAAPPVYAYLHSNLEIFTPKIKQVYATGRAALIATKRNSEKEEDPHILEGEIESQMQFGTFTHFGFKIGFDGNVPENVVLGYKRYEASSIPPVKDSKDKNKVRYGSVLASIDIGAEAKENPVFSNYQYFGTGGAAEELASNSEIQTRFDLQARKALKIVCNTAPDANSKIIEDFMLKSPGNPNIVRAIIVRELGISILPVELRNCDKYAKQRKEIVKKYRLDM